MIVAVLLPEDKLEKVKQSLENQKSAGITFEYYTSTATVFDLIRDRGFYMDKLVIIASVISNFNEADMQVLIDNLFNICENFLMGSTKELLMIDSSKIFESNYHQFFFPYQQFVYQTQRIHPSQLFNLIAGNFKVEENPNIDQEAKKPSLLSRFLNRKRQTLDDTLPNDESEVNPEVESDDELENNTESEESTTYSCSPLFSDEDTAEVDQSVKDEEPSLSDFDIDLTVDSTEDSTEDELEPDNEEYSKDPLFRDPEPVPEVATSAEVKVVPESKQERVTHSKKQAAPRSRAKLQDTPKPTSAPVPVTSVNKRKVTKTYVDFFRKRSKTILFTGDRRTGTSTLVSNLAEQASQDGLAVLLIDLDYERRGQAVNFPIVCDDNDVQTILSLYHAIKSASNLEKYALSLNDNLDFLGTLLSAESTDFMFEHVTNDALQTLLSIAMGRYDLILIDCPFLEIKMYPCLVGMSNYVIHSIPTDTRGLINCINMLTPEDFDTETSYSVYLSKAMFVLNMYLSHFWKNVEITEKNVMDYLCDLTQDAVYRNLTVLGRIPMFHDYDEFMSNGKLLVQEKKYSNIFVELLNDIATKG